MQYDHLGYFEARLRQIPLEKAGIGGAYLHIKDKNGRFTHGGDQNWWLDDAMAEKVRSHERLRFKACRKDDHFRLANLGCGVIAMINLEIYLERHHKKNIDAAAPDKSGKAAPGSVNFDNDTSMTREDYQAFALKKWHERYHIGKSYVSFKAGLSPVKMEIGLRKFLKEHELERRRVNWAPYVLHTPAKQKELVLAAIKDMLDADYPVVFAYHTFDEKNSSINLYRNLEDALLAKEGKKGNERVGSHYMTILGVFKGNNGETVLQVESWGRIYYCVYDEFAKKLSYFSNILCIRP